MALSAKALRQLNNERAAKYYGIAIAGLIAVFTLGHWSRLAYRRYGSRQKGPLASHIVAISRVFRSIMGRKAPGFTSVGHFFLFLIYLIINIILTFVHMDWSALHNLSKRLGWIALCNIELVVFLSLKNTPLAFLTHYTHNLLNSLHRAAGYTLVIYSMLHAIIYLKAWGDEGSLGEMREWANVAGVIGGISMLIIAVTSAFLRNRNYEWFYIIHVIFFVLIMIMLGFHRPDMTKKVPIIIMVGSGLWFVDRVIRGFRLVSNFIVLGNYATVTALDCGKGTRVVLKKGGWGAKVGTHAFLWIPGIRMLETHPFTITRVDSDAVEFVVNSLDGFTGALYDYATKNPGARLRAGIDGPYGTLPSFEDASKVVYIAGGSGATYSACMAAALTKQASIAGKLVIELIWVVRNEGQISWFTRELEELQAAPNVAINLFCSKSSPQTETSSKSLSTTSTSTGAKRKSSENVVTASNVDVEKQAISSDPSTISNISSPLTNLQITPGRPDLSALITKSVKQASSEERVLIFACGPDEMMLEVRKTVARLLGEDVKGSASVELHSEAFGW